MERTDARNPYSGLNDTIRKLAQGEMPTYLTIGKVMRVDPLLIRAAGLDLDADDLRIAQHLTQQETRTRTMLPEATFHGVDSMGGPCYVIRPKEYVYGRPKWPEQPPGALLCEGDEVLLMPSEDGQIYYVLERMVPVEPLAADPDE